tara:strand:+ start:1852 stop:2094 length:243 start_codon:yes stop_codon:yes gene_type:complete
MGKKFNFEFIPLTRDQIKEMSSSELSFNISKFRRFIKEANYINVDTVPFETELCYLDHERQVREKIERAQCVSNNTFQGK